MSIVLYFLCLNVGVALGVILATAVREQRAALDAHTLRQAEND